MVMLGFDPKGLSERENYKLLIGSIIPRPIAFVTTLSEAGIVNGAPFSYFNIVSSNPPMLSLSIQRRQGELKDTAANIYQNGQFVVHLVDRHNVALINETAASLPASQSELELASLTPIKSEKVAVPGIMQAKVRMECRLVQAIALPQQQPSSDLLIGEIVHYHIDESIYEAGRINPERLAAVSRLAGNNYAEIGNIFEIERPQ